MKYKYLLPNGAQQMGKALEYTRSVAKQADSALVHAVACEPEFICESMRIWPRRTRRRVRVWRHR